MANITAACIGRQSGRLVDPLRKTIIHLSYSAIGVFRQERINLPLPCGGLNIGNSCCNHRPRFVVGSINLFYDMWEWTADRREHTKLLTHKTSVSIARTFLIYLDGNNAPANTRRQITPDMDLPGRCGLGKSAVFAKHMKLRQWVNMVCLPRRGSLYASFPVAEYQASLAPEYSATRLRDLSIQAIRLTIS
jgi:hypothetical protein